MSVLTPFAGLLTLLVFGGGDLLAAQEPWVRVLGYDERTSRDAFAGCDENGDDRIDIREATRALPNMVDSRGPVGFQTLDVNRNGYLQWPEFDAHFRSLIDRGASFNFRPAFEFHLNPMSRTPAATSRAQRIAEFTITLVALDDDPEMSKQEFAKLVTTLGQPPETNTLFPTIDTDRSGTISAAELRPIVANVPALLELVEKSPTPLAGVDVAERLERMHPTLGRWKREIIRAADKNGDGVLVESELRRK